MNSSESNDMSCQPVNFHKAAASLTALVRDGVSRRSGRGTKISLGEPVGKFIPDTGDLFINYYNNGAIPGRG